MIFQGDVTIKRAIELGLEDLRRNPWLVDDILSDMVDNPNLSDRYGKAEIDRAKDWLKSNKIDILMRYRRDKDEYPCITIALGSSNELDNMRTLADQSEEVIQVNPQDVDLRIGYVVNPFIPDSYDEDTGVVEIPENVSNEDVETGMIAVDPSTGKGFTISGKAGDNGFAISPGSKLDFDKIGILPQYRYFRVRRERSWFQESYTIGCHVHGDPAPLLWLHTFVVHTLLRYRESLLEAQGFAETGINSSDMAPNNALSQQVAGDQVYSRFITISGKVENTWLKTPRRVIESVGLETPGITYIGDPSPDVINDEEELWTTAEDWSE